MSKISKNITKNVPSTTNLSDLSSKRLHGNTTAFQPPKKVLTEKKYFKVNHINLWDYNLHFFNIHFLSQVFLDFCCIDYTVIKINNLFDFFNEMNIISNLKKHALSGIEQNI